MSYTTYTPHAWGDEQTIYTQSMNHIQQGIDEASKEIISLKQDINTLEQDINTLNQKKYADYDAVISAYNETNSWTTGWNFQILKGNWNTVASKLINDSNYLPRVLVLVKHVYSSIFSSNDGIIHYYISDASVPWFCVTTNAFMKSSSSGSLNNQNPLAYILSFQWFSDNSITVY